MKRITDPTFRYYSSADTDLRRTFARVRRQQREDAAKLAAQVREAIPLRKRAAK